MFSHLGLEQPSVAVRAHLGRVDDGLLAPSDDRVFAEQHQSVRRPVVSLLVLLACLNGTQ